MKALEIEHLHYTYPDGTEALRDVTLTVPPGSRTVILGANGSGKSTLLLHTNGLLQPQAGKVRVLGREWCEKELRELRARVGMVFQDPDDQLFATTVAEDVAFGPRNLGLDEETVQIRTENALALLEIRDLANRPPHHLSLGQKKRAAIAGVLVMEPEVLVMDEPTASLDPLAVKQFKTLLQNIHQQGRTIILATHDVDFAYEWADQVIILAGGRVIADGSASILQNEALLKSAALEPPLLLQIFRNTGITPRSADDANRMLKRMVQKDASRPRLH